MYRRPATVQCYISNAIRSLSYLYWSYFIVSVIPALNASSSTSQQKVLIAEGDKCNSGLPVTRPDDRFIISCRASWMRGKLHCRHKWAGKLIRLIIYVCACKWMCVYIYIWKRMWFTILDADSKMHTQYAMGDVACIYMYIKEDP